MTNNVISKKILEQINNNIEPIMTDYQISSDEFGMILEVLQNENMIKGLLQTKLGERYLVTNAKDARITLGGLAYLKDSELASKKMEQIKEILVQLDNGVKPESKGIGDEERYNGDLLDLMQDAELIENVNFTRTGNEILLIFGEKTTITDKGLNFIK